MKFETCDRCGNTRALPDLEHWDKWGRLTTPREGDHLNVSLCPDCTTAVLRWVADTPPERSAPRPHP